jgi:lipoate-protein ligase A
MRQWRLIYDKPRRGADNMARDEAVLNAVSQQSAAPTLRLYRWEPPCLSIGYGQPVNDVDRERLLERGWDIVRRPTGGRAILHADELTYSVTLSSDHPLAEGGVIESYRRISRALLAALDSLGLRPQAQQVNQPNAEGPVCFETPSHYEITANGKKLVGSAQARKKGGVLQHGTLPLYGDMTRVCDALRYDDATARARAKAQVRARATTLEEAVGGCAVDWNAAAHALVTGFRETFQIDFVEQELSDVEREHAQQLTRDVFGNEAWTNRR